MIANAAVRNLIREARTFELHSVMQLSSRDGMQTLDEALASLVRRRMVTLEEALIKTSNQVRLKRILEFEVDARPV